ncbi:MAG: hypothetical protein AB1443_09470 [Pseudomonadota bacterium]
MNARRLPFALFAALSVFAGGSVFAAPPVVEIVAMPHPPVKMALQPLRDWLGQQGAKLKVVETDVESPAGEKKLAGVGLSGHIPVVILIDGQYRVKRPDGATVDLVNFPNQPNTPPGARGQWVIPDVQAVLTERMKKP